MSALTVTIAAAGDWTAAAALEHGFDTGAIDTEAIAEGQIPADATPAERRRAAHEIAKRVARHAGLSLQGEPIRTDGVLDDDDGDSGGIPATVYAWEVYENIICGFGGRHDLDDDLDNGTYLDNA